MTGQHRQAYAYCAFCPKVCRFACPVADSTKNESTSTWGKMSEAFLVTEGKRALDVDGAKSLYACTGCMRCRSFCRHENEVGFALFAARQEAIVQGLAPKAVTSTLETFARHKNPFGVDLSDAVARFRPDSPVRYALFPGCSALAKRPSLVDDALAVGHALAAPLGVCRASVRCCGYPLYAAGDLAGFAEHAALFARSLDAYPELVVLDPGCAYTLLVTYPRVGVEVKSRIRTLYDVLASHLGHAPSRPKLPMRAVYHDACKLGRGLGQYEEPRALLSAAVEEVIEGAEREAEAGCAGGGGLLPRTMPDTSVDMARRLSSELALGGETIVTACPTSRRIFDRAGRQADDLLSVLRRWLEPRE